MHSATVNVNSRDLYGSTALHYAAANNDVSRIKQLLTQGADVDVRDEKFNRTPLHDAMVENVSKSHFKVAEILLKNGASVNARDYQGRTPLNFLVRRGNVKIAQLFLSFGADVHVIDTQGCNLLFSAAGYNDDEKVMKLLVDLGLDVNHHNAKGQTPLHWACNLDFDNLKTVKFLLDSGANMNAVDHRGYTPLIEALRGRSKKSSEHVKKKNLSFILEHTDFNYIAYKDSNILSLDYELDEDYLWKMILEHLAKLSLKSSVHLTLLNAISRQDEYSFYYEQYKGQLLIGKNSKVFKVNFN